MKKQSSTQRRSRDEQRGSGRRLTRMFRGSATLHTQGFLEKNVQGLEELRQRDQRRLSLSLESLSIKDTQKVTSK